MGLLGDSEDKGTCHQAWQHTFNLSELDGGRREMVPESCPCLHMYAVTCVHPQCIHAFKMNQSKCSTRFKTYFSQFRGLGSLRLIFHGTHSDESPLPPPPSSDLTFLGRSMALCFLIRVLFVKVESSQLNDFQRACPKVPLPGGEE